MDQPIIPATFPATPEERAELEDALPGYRFVDPVGHGAFAAAAAKKKKPMAQTIADIIEETKGEK